MRSTRDLVTSIAFSTLLSMVFCAICACCKAYSAHGIFSGMLSSAEFLVGDSPDDSPEMADIFSFQNQAQSLRGFPFFSCSFCYLYTPSFFLFCRVGSGRAVYGLMRVIRFWILDTGRVNNLWHFFYILIYYLLIIIFV